MARDVVLRVAAVSKAFDLPPGKVHRAVSNVTFDVARGSFFSLLGPSGCGKTTLLRIIAGLEKASSGEIHLSGKRIDDLPPHQRNVNTVFQNYALFPHLTIRGNVEFGLRYPRSGKGAASAAEAARRLASVLEQVRLGDKADRMPNQLSGGERQRVALARTLVLEPEVLLLDEPLAALDPLLRKHVRSELKDLQREVGVTFLFVTHDQEEALALSDQIAVMHNGVVEQIGTPREVYRYPSTRFVAGFLGTMNWLRRSESGKELGLRPEMIRVSKDGQGIPAELVRLTYLGSVEHAELRLDTGESITAQVPCNSCPCAGQKLFVQWNPEDEIWL